ncbi:hypothetical protein ACQ4LH_21505, partial [Pseudomonas peli]
MYKRQPTDSPVLQARIAVDLAVRALEGRAHARRVSPMIEMLDQVSLEQVLSLLHIWRRRRRPPSGDIW